MLHAASPKIYKMRGRQNKAGNDHQSKLILWIVVANNHRRGQKEDAPAAKPKHPFKTMQ